MIEISMQPKISSTSVQDVAPLRETSHFSERRTSPNEHALLSGFLAGLLAQLTGHPAFLDFSLKLKNIADYFLNRFFIPFVLLFVLGFSLKLEHEGTLSMIAKNYAPILLLFVSVEILSIGLIYAISARFKPRTMAQMIQNVLPSIISGFSTISSAGSMPLIMKGAERNTGKADLTHAIVPMTVNNHLIGDALFICLMSLIFVVSSGDPMPSLGTYLNFALYYSLAMFGMAAVPGGGIIVMIPILERHLGLNAEILSLMTTLYILFDPINTAANVAGNGSFTVLLAKGFSRLKKQEVLS
jgi:Na+/H+-dicarboxylate symporter